MKLIIAVLAVVSLSLSALVSGASSRSRNPPRFAEYAGDWTATFDGKVWLRLRLEVRDDQITGALLRASKLAVNDNGELKSVSDEQSGETVTSAVLNPDGLLLTLKSADSQETDRYMMRIVTAEKDNAELKMIAMTMPPGMPKPKPWRLVKSGIAHTNKVAAPR